MENTLAIYWLKRDFRLADNPALTEALANHKTVVPIYIFEPSFLDAPETSAFHIHAVTNALTDLRLQLEPFDTDIAIFHGETIPTLEKLFQRHPFHHIYSHEEIGVERTYARDREVAEWCKKMKINWTELPQTGVFRALKDRNKRSRLWKKFTFAELLPKPDRSDLQRLQIPEQWTELLMPGGRTITLEDSRFELSGASKEQVQAVSESAAHLTLQDFLYNRGIAYRGGISSPLTAFMAGSRMSVHLAWGTISGRWVYQKAKERKEELKASEDPDKGKWSGSLTSFLSRLHWRDHFIQRLETEPQMEFEALNPAYEALEYDNDPEFLNAWIEGRTGFPMVDACIRCLRTTGFINFRMRAMLTSVACHTLHLDWRLIDHPMARMYTDYEPGIHLSQLQMQASVVGINSIRMYSPTKQIKDQDPETIFIKEWVPELRPYSPKQIIEHAKDPVDGYPDALVDWWESSRRMRSKIWEIRKLEETKEIAQEVYQKHGSRMGPMSKRRRTASDKKKTEKSAKIEK